MSWKDKVWNFILTFDFYDAFVITYMYSLKYLYRNNIILVRDL